jgi:hypothetical protein
METHLFSCGFISICELNFNIFSLVDKSNMFFFFVGDVVLILSSLLASELRHLHRRVAEWHPGDYFM